MVPVALEIPTMFHCSTEINVPIDILITNEKGALKENRLCTFKDNSKKE